eukprot:Protomagalhaensia_sp_Gyna_25__487@NODE_122_length_5089_cov_31_674653_g96_i0_p2_GENE_NODE_122_length_5089_cov_31_674653_g96_i0NODE_122_length_5089_cov_31_674653_g96_i0_p2_ORF_typecomplete_len560_score91_82SWIRM/PF04433_17/1_6e14Myb_DNAbind_6/PF13921_6/0_011Myb_DNAbinding/PF00249_31/0_069_NODE_122_length_5089_cov_31_674653_g96_i07402419
MLSADDSITNGVKEDSSEQAIFAPAMPAVLHFNCKPGSNGVPVELAELKSQPDDHHGIKPESLSDVGSEDLTALQESVIPGTLKEDLLTAARGAVPVQQAAPAVQQPVQQQPLIPSMPPSIVQQQPPQPDMPPAPSLYKLPDAMGPVRTGLPGGPPTAADQPPQPPPTLLRTGPLPALLPGAPPMHPQFPQVPVVSVPPQPQFPGATPPPFPPCPWFDPTAITQEEVDELRVSFPALRVCRPASDGDRANLAYLTLRNTLIDVYRSNPAQKLTLAECRKHCDGDLAALLRVLSFLERNRLVNFCIDTSQAPTGGVADTRLRNELAKQWGRTPTCTACDRICLYSFYILSPQAYGATVPLPHLKAAVWCPDCAREAPHNQFLLKVNLPALHVSGGAASWSEPQINVLFDAVESHGSDWVQVSKAVSSVPGNPIRSPRECLAAFLSMPITEHVQTTYVPLKDEPSMPAVSKPATMSGTVTESATTTNESPPTNNAATTAKGWEEHDPAAVSMGLEILLTAMEAIKKRSDNPDAMLDGLSKIVRERMEQRIPTSINELSFMQ